MLDSPNYFQPYGSTPEFTVLSENVGDLKYNPMYRDFLAKIWNAILTGKIQSSRAIINTIFFQWIPNARQIDVSDDGCCISINAPKDRKSNLKGMKNIFLQANKNNNTLKDIALKEEGGRCLLKINLKQPLSQDRAYIKNLASNANWHVHGAEKIFDDTPIFPCNKNSKKNRHFSQVFFATILVCISALAIVNLAEAILSIIAFTVLSLIYAPLFIVFFILTGAVLTMMIKEEANTMFSKNLSEYLGKFDSTRIAIHDIGEITHSENKNTKLCMCNKLLQEIYQIPDISFNKIDDRDIEIANSVNNQKSSEESLPPPVNKHKIDYKDIIDETSATSEDLVESEDLIELIKIKNDFFRYNPDQKTPSTKQSINTNLQQSKSDQISIFTSQEINR